MPGPATPAASRDLDRRVRAYTFRWRAVLAVFVLLIAALGALGGYSIDQARHAVEQDAEITRAAARADDVARVSRENFCAFLDVVIRNEPPDPTPDQAARWDAYRMMYGAGSPDLPGLECQKGPAS